MNPDDELDPQGRPSLAAIVAQHDRPSLDEIVARHDEGNTPSPLQAQVRAALKRPEGRKRIEQGYRDQFEAEMPSVGDYGRNIAENATALGASLVKDIPGAEAVQAGARGLIRGQPYREALQDIQGAEDRLPASVRIPARLAGGAVATLAVPGSAAAQGAAMGGAGQLLNSDPDSKIVPRLFRGAGGAIAGGLIGKGTEMAGTAIRTLRPKILGGTGGAEAAKDAALADRSEGTGAWLYDMVRKSPARPMTPEFQAILNKSDIAPVAERILTLEQHQGKSLTDPDVIIAIRKELTDWGHTLDKSGAVTDPGKPNLISGLKDHVKLLKQQFDAAADKQVPGFAEAVKSFADESIPLSGQEAGYEAMRRSMSSTLPAWKNVGKKTPGAMDDFLKRPASAKGAIEGISAATRDEFANGGRLKSLYHAGPLLRKADAAAAQPMQAGANSAFLALLNSLVNP